MNTTQHSEKDLPRRTFLRRSAALVGAAGAGLVAAGAQAADEAAVAAAPVPEPDTGYSESEHVKRYYRMADF